MINLNNLNKILISLFLFSCTVTTNEKSQIKKENIVKKEGYFQKSNIEISALEDYELEFNISEKYNIVNDINGINISHKSLPIPSVVKISNPNNLKNYLIARNIKSDSSFRFSVSSEIADILAVKTNIYIEYLKEESLNLRKVEESKEESVIKMDSTMITSSTLEDDQKGLSSKLDYSKIENLEAKIDRYKNMLLVGSYDNLASAKLETNKIKNLGLIIEEIDKKILVFAGPFNNNNINLKLDFLIKNGYSNAKNYP